MTLFAINKETSKRPEMQTASRAPFERDARWLEAAFYDGGSSERFRNITAGFKSITTLGHIITLFLQSWRAHSN
jgi:hypothetical protein